MHAMPIAAVVKSGTVDVLYERWPVGSHPERFSRDESIGHQHSHPAADRNR
jgi:hypothetical protein